MRPKRAKLSKSSLQSAAGSWCSLEDSFVVVVLFCCFFNSPCHNIIISLGNPGKRGMHTCVCTCMHVSNEYSFVNDLGKQKLEVKEGD